MKDLALVIVMIIFLGLCFLPVLFVKAGSKSKRPIAWIGAALAMLLIPSLRYDLAGLQMVMIIAWGGLIFWAVVDRF